MIDGIREGLTYLKNKKIEKATIANSGELKMMGEIFGSDIFDDKLEDMKDSEQNNQVISSYDVVGELEEDDYMNNIEDYLPEEMIKVLNGRGEHAWTCFNAGINAGIEKRKSQMS